jgi:uncharacterized iron-regulated protein
LQGLQRCSPFFIPTFNRVRTASALLLAACCALSACASRPVPLDEQRLAAELRQRPIVLLGEIHDNRAQHRIRRQALERLLQAGARPALAFEQFDHERQADIERARHENPPDGRTLAQHVIDAARTPGDTWNWDDYRPFVELALQYDVPIVAANLSRAGATRVAREGYAAAFSSEKRDALALERVDPALFRRHERIAGEAHCNLLPQAALAGLARAQIARDAVLAQSIRHHASRGVVLLTGNGHARRDIGVPRHLSEVERSRTWSIGLLESEIANPAAYDVAFVSKPQPRDDPCRRVLPAQR